MNPSISLQIQGIIMLVIGIAIRYWIAKRKFNRRAITGAQQFNSYQESIFIRVFEWLAKWAGIILIVTGVILIIMRYVKH
jgi:uncharacterized protein YjeT (DUF2065 family)